MDAATYDGRVLIPVMLSLTFLDWFRTHGLVEKLDMDVGVSYLYTTGGQYEMSANTWW